MSTSIPFVFFGSSAFSVHVLEALETSGMLPVAIVTMPDQPKGRKLIITQTEVADWADKKNIPVLKPQTLKTEEVIEQLKKFNAQVFIVASYGKIIPESILYLPSHKTLNIHPSLLPKYRGASPIQSMILANEKEVGVSIMELDKEMDHGPIFVSNITTPPIWPIAYEMAEQYLATAGGILLAKVLPDILNGTLKPIPQDHTQATYTSKINKTDAQLDLTADPFENFKKILAYHHWPKAFYFDDGKRVIVTEANFDQEKNTLTFTKVIPEGKKEMSFADYERGKKK